MSTFLLLPSPSCASLLSKESGRVSNLASIHSHKPLVKGFRVRALREKTEEIKSPSSQTSSSAEDCEARVRQIGFRTGTGCAPGAGTPWVRSGTLRCAPKIFGYVAGNWVRRRCVSGAAAGYFSCSTFVLHFSLRNAYPHLGFFEIAVPRTRYRTRTGYRTGTRASQAEEVTKKYGLEAGLWKIFSSKEEENGNSGEKSKGDQAKELLAKYGGAYLATSITLSLISFTLCYALINAGVDVQSLLQKVGISPNEAGEKVGTFALAYAAHKAASPIRFPPTVALTPIVANWIGKKVEKEK